MSYSFKKLLRSVKHKIINLLGLVRLPPDSKIVLSQTTWKFQRDFFVNLLNIDLAIDAGANLGQWALEFRSISDAEIISFEPDVRCKERLDNLCSKDPLWTVHYLALGSANKSEEINSWDVQGGSTSINRLTSFGEKFTSWTNEMTSKKKIEVVRVDNFLKDFNVETKNAILKIDVQGYEKEVLIGSTGAIEYFQIIEIELPFVEIYEGSSKAGELICRIEDLGFDLVSISSERWASPGAADCDALFIRRETYKEIKEGKLGLIHNV